MIFLPPLAFGGKKISILPPSFTLGSPDFSSFICKGLLPPHQPSSKGAADRAQKPTEHGGFLLRFRQESVGILGEVIRLSRHVVQKLKTLPPRQYILNLSFQTSLR